MPVGRLNSSESFVVLSGGRTYNHDIICVGIRKVDHFMEV